MHAQYDKLCRARDIITYMKRVNLDEKLIQTKREDIINLAVEALEKSGLVIYPTETCYGIAADATNQAAVDKLLRYKSRREGKPISIAVLDESMARNYAEINEIAHSIYANFLPGPITVVSKAKDTLADGVSSEFTTIGIRIPDYPLVLEIIKKLGRPITATSANISYNPRPYNIDKYLKETPEKHLKHIDLIIDAGILKPNDPSTVVDTTLNNMNVMRQGRIILSKQTSEKDPVLSAITNKPEETVDFGGLNMLKFIDVPLEQPLVFLLSGELGAGKTQFSKGVGKQLGIDRIIKSPTYNIMSEYNYDQGHRAGKLIHVDFWKLDNYDLLKLNEYMRPGNVLIIEWADKFLSEMLDDFDKSSAKVIHVVFKPESLTSRSIKSYEIKEGELLQNDG
ncbi:threonylcarbamoyl-AMP synthase [Candidatus Dojkabacteria bacterium]|nr:threonylcarbamoyl-AMP synthase [Candidatus Dojkabacteria bacterium]